MPGRHPPLCCTLTLVAMQGHPFIIIYSNSAIDPYTTSSYSLEHKKYHNIVIGKEKYIYILQQVRRDILLMIYIRPDSHAQFANKMSVSFFFFFFLWRCRFSRVLYVCMYVWSSHIAEYGSTG